MIMSVSTFKSAVILYSKNLKKKFIGDIKRLPSNNHSIQVIVFVVSLEKFFCNFH